MNKTVSILPQFPERITQVALRLPSVEALISALQSVEIVSDRHKRPDAWTCQHRDHNGQSKLPEIESMADDPSKDQIRQHRCKCRN